MDLQFILILIVSSRDTKCHFNHSFSVEYSGFCSEVLCDFFEEFKKWPKVKIWSSAGWKEILQFSSVLRRLLLRAYRMKSFQGQSSIPLILHADMSYIAFRLFRRFFGKKHYVVQLENTVPDRR